MPWTGRGSTSAATRRELSRLELAIRNLEHTWLFLEREDATLVSEPSLPTAATELQMRILEAQEAERARLAQEVHDGPAQALSNAIFQVEFIDRVFESDPRMAQAELRFLRELLRRELGDVRSFLTQLRPPVLAELGLYGAIIDTVSTQAALSGLHISTELGRPTDGLAEPDPDGGAAHRAGGTAECAQARRRRRTWSSPRGSRMDNGRSRSATTVAASTPERWRPVAVATSVCSSCVSGPSWSARSSRFVRGRRRVRSYGSRSR